MTTREAAKLIGCTDGQVRTLVRKGLIIASKVSTPIGSYWQISEASARAYASKPQTQGYPRGQKRT